MSLATIINKNGELEYKNIATDNVRLRSNTQEQTLSANIIQVLLNRIAALEDYVLAHQATYTITNADGIPIQLVVDTSAGFRDSFLDMKGGGTAPPGSE